MRRIAYRSRRPGTRTRQCTCWSRAARGSSSAARPEPDPAGQADGRDRGDGVTDLALEVGSAEAAYDYAVAHGARGLEAPHLLEDDYGKVVVAAIATFGDTRHTLVERSGYSGPCLPGFVPAAPVTAPGERALFTEIDHCVGDVELGKMDQWVDFYHRVMGFTNMKEFVGDDIATEYSALMSKVITADDRKVKFPLERARGRQAQVADRRVPGVLRRPRRAAHRAGHRRHRGQRPRHDRGQRGVPAHPGQLLRRPSAAGRPTRVHVDELRELGILADRDEDGYLR